MSALNKIMMDPKRPV